MIQSGESYTAPTLKELLILEHYAFSGALLPKRLVHSILAGNNASKLRGRGLDFSEVRKYVAGDDIRNIDWKVTARTKVTHTKVFNEEKERPVFALVDQTSFMFFGSELYTKNVIAAQLAALSGFRTLKAGDRFGGIVFGDESEEFVSPKRSRVALIRFLELVVAKGKLLAEHNRLQNNQNRLNEMLKKTSLSVTHDYVVVVVSDFSNANEETFKQLTNLSYHNDVILFNISDALENQTPDDRLLMTDGKYQLMVKDGKKMQAAFEEEKKRKEAFFKSLRKYNVVSMQLSTNESAIKQMKNIFAKTV